MQIISQVGVNLKFGGSSPFQERSDFRTSPTRHCSLQKILKLLVSSPSSTICLALALALSGPSVNLGKLV